jgi:hypothetical protein
MTIVIQHRFWDLKVEQSAFSVGLSFGGVPSSLRVPFAAVTDFVDPAVDFSLKFQASGAEAQPEEHDEAENDAPVAEAEDGSNVVNVDFTRKKEQSAVIASVAKQSSPSGPPCRCAPRDDDSQ